MASGCEQKVVLITGCSSGIGLRIAVLLARDDQKRYHGKRAHLRRFSVQTSICCLFIPILEVIRSFVTQLVDVFCTFTH